MPTLKDPITIRDMEIKNRLAYAPMLSMSYDSKGKPTKRTYNLYEVKARGGIGMITLESVSVAPVTTKLNTTANWDAVEFTRINRFCLSCGFQSIHRTYRAIKGRSNPCD